MIKKAKTIGITCVLIYVAICLIGLGFKLLIYGLVGTLLTIVFLYGFGKLMGSIFKKGNGTNRKNSTRYTNGVSVEEGKKP